MRIIPIIVVLMDQNVNDNLPGNNKADKRYSPIGLILRGFSTTYAPSCYVDDNLGNHD